jgi:hypothetical protein
MDQGSEIRDTKTGNKRGVKKTLDSGSGSATLTGSTVGTVPTYRLLIVKWTAPVFFSLSF